MRVANLEQFAQFIAAEGFALTVDTIEPLGPHTLALGKVGTFRVFQGTIRKDQQLFVGDAKRPFKVAHLYRVQGKDMVEVAELIPGEIGAIAKVEEVAIDCVLHDSHEEDHIHLQSTQVPPPMHGLAIAPRKKGDEQRLSEVLGKLGGDPAGELLPILREGADQRQPLRRQILAAAGYCTLDPK